MPLSIHTIDSKFGMYTGSMGEASLACDSSQVSGSARVSNGALNGSRNLSRAHSQELRRYIWPLMQTWHDVANKDLGCACEYHTQRLEWLFPRGKCEDLQYLNVGFQQNKWVTYPAAALVVNRRMFICL